MARPRRTRPRDKIRPPIWTEPLGEGIATSESIGGVRHATDGPNPVPASIGELTERVIRQARRVLAWHGVTPGQTALADLYADDATRALARRDPMRVDFPARDGGTVGVGIGYGETPAIGAGRTRAILTHLRNGQADPAAVECRWQLPPGWSVSPGKGAATVAPGAEAALAWEITAPEPARLEVSNTLYLQTTVRERPAQPAVPVTLIGAARYRRTEIYPDDGRSVAERLDAALAPETLAGGPLTATGRPGRWETFDAPDNALPLEEFFAGPGTLYVQTFVYSPVERLKCSFGAPSTGPVRMWVNGEPCAECRDEQPFRPNYGGVGQEAQAFGRATLRVGWNEVLLKFVRAADTPPFACHLLLSMDEWLAGLTDVGRTRFPWEG